MGGNCYTSRQTYENIKNYLFVIFPKKCIYQIYVFQFLKLYVFVIFAILPVEADTGCTWAGVEFRVDVTASESGFTFSS